MDSPNTFGRQVGADIQGGVAVTFALLLPLICGFVALAIDINRSATVSRRLEQALDTAALAGAKLLDLDEVSDGEIIDRVTNFYMAQAPILGLPPDILANLAVTIDRTNNSVTASATGAMNTTFAKIIGIKAVPINKSATVVYKMRDVELALVLDTTGSMGDVPVGDTQTKIQSLKSAATTVVDTLYSQAINERGILIAIAPFSSSVNAGPYAGSTIASAGGGDTYLMMSSFRDGGATPGTGCAIERLGAETTTDAGPYGSNLLRDLSTTGNSGNPCPSTPIMPLTGRSQRASIDATIANFSPGGSTAGHIGAAWGWYMLSPNWNGIFTSSNAPGAYNNPNISKNLVLMTDGAAGTASATAESYQQFDALCAGVKAKAINVFTIGFGLTDATANAELKSYASSAANFFTVATGSELEAASSAIVAKLNQLRISR